MSAGSETEKPVRIVAEIAPLGRLVYHLHVVFLNFIRHRADGSVDINGLTRDGESFGQVRPAGKAQVADKVPGKRSEKTDGRAPTATFSGRRAPGPQEEADRRQYQQSPLCLLIKPIFCPVLFDSAAPHLHFP
jgi:hypothetical protein